MKTSRAICDGALRPLIEIAEELAQRGAQDLSACYQCGTCSGVCPWLPVNGFNVRVLLEQANFGGDGIATPAWNCTQCGLCAEHCPNEIDLLGIVKAVRAFINEQGKLPPGISQALGSIATAGNPWGGQLFDKVRWAQHCGFDASLDEPELTLFVCCTSAYDPPGQGEGASLQRLLRQTGHRAVYDPASQSCCGEAALSCGSTRLAAAVAEHNSSALAGASWVITNSPHCLKVLPTLPSSGPRRVQHVVDFLWEQFEANRLLIPRGRPVRVAYHDPCYLGRHQGLYDAPRQLLTARGGLELVELSRNREDSLCCGGGGGGIWREVPAGQRLADVRVIDAVERGAQVLATACPYCVLMLNASVTALDLSHQLRVATVTELLTDPLAPPPVHGGGQP
jgi:Fe-S oxidoreductase